MFLLQKLLRTSYPVLSKPKFLWRNSRYVTNWMFYVISDSNKFCDQKWSRVECDRVCFLASLTRTASFLEEVRFNQKPTWSEEVSHKRDYLGRNHCWQKEQQEEALRQECVWGNSAFVLSEKAQRGADELESRIRSQNMQHLH